MQLSSHPAASIARTPEPVLLACHYCGQSHRPAALDKIGRYVCAACAWAALRLCGDIFGTLPRKD